MSKKSEKVFPMEDVDLIGYIKNAWTKGWFDEYSNEHFLIRTIENQVTDIEWKTQLICNNSNSIHTPLYQNGGINFNAFSSNFIVNLSSQLFQISKTFGEGKIKRFIEEQLSAGKDQYDRDKFFQALSEIEILSFYCRKSKWDKVIYEPPIGINGANPEARFEAVLHGKDESDQINVKINIEVKTPRFPVVSDMKNKTVIPTILLSDTGGKKCKNYVRKTIQNAFFLE